MSSRGRRLSEQDRPSTEYQRYQNSRTSILQPVLFFSTSFELIDTLFTVRGGSFDRERIDEIYRQESRCDRVLRSRRETIRWIDRWIAIYERLGRSRDAFAGSRVVRGQFSVVERTESNSPTRYEETRRRASRRFIPIGCPEQRRRTREATRRKRPRQPRKAPDDAPQPVRTEPPPEKSSSRSSFHLFAILLQPHAASPLTQANRYIRLLTY